MNAKEFEKHSQDLINHCWKLLFSKCKEYANNEDRLANFKQPTSLFKTNPAKICLMYDSKHIASMVKIADDVDKGILPSKELLKEKVGDYINYGLLFYGNMLELMGKKDTAVNFGIKDVDGEKEIITKDEFVEILNGLD